MRGFTRQQLLVALIASTLSTSAVRAQNGRFEPKCAWPFNETATRQAFDDRCNEGKTNDPGTQVQDVVKDNFCADGTPITIDIPTLKRLQTEVESPNVLGRARWRACNKSHRVERHSMTFQDVGILHSCAGGRGSQLAGSNPFG
jgi:hypothetical protein